MPTRTAHQMRRQSGERERTAKGNDMIRTVRTTSVGLCAVAFVMVVSVLSFPSVAAAADIVRWHYPHYPRAFLPIRGVYKDRTGEVNIVFHLYAPTGPHEAKIVSVQTGKVIEFMSNMTSKGDEEWTTLEAFLEADSVEWAQVIPKARQEFPDFNLDIGFKTGCRYDFGSTLMVPGENGTRELFAVLYPLDDTTRITRTREKPFCEGVGKTNPQLAAITAVPSAVFQSGGVLFADKEGRIAAYFEEIAPGRRARGDGMEAVLVDADATMAVLNRMYDPGRMPENGVGAIEVGTRLVREWLVERSQDTGGVNE